MRLHRPAHLAGRIGLVSACVLLLTTSTASANDEWLQHISEEAGGITKCKNGLMNGIHCKGDYCDEISLRCGTVSGLKRTTSWTPFHSDEDSDSPLMCPEDYFISQLKCDGRYCDNLSVQCTQGPGKSSDCKWLNDGQIVSEEDGGRLTVDAPRTYVRGIQCSGRYCDDKKLFVCTLPQGTITKIVPRWVLVDSCAGEGCALTHTMTVGISSDETAVKGEEWASSVTMSIEAKAGGDDIGGSVTVGLAASFSETQKTELRKSLSTSTTKSTATACGEQGKGSTKAVYQYQYEVYESCVTDGTCSPATIGGVSTVCVIDPPGGAANFRPICAPGCCKNGLCTECHTEGACAGGPEGIKTAAADEPPPAPPSEDDAPAESPPMEQAAAKPPAPVAASEAPVAEKKSGCAAGGGGAPLQALALGLGVLGMLVSRTRRRPLDR